MQDINWLQILIGFLSGGAFGALIRQYFEDRRNKIQPIFRFIEVKSFYNSEKNDFFNSQIILTGTTKEYKFSRLYTGTIELINMGLNDYSEFGLGITCPEEIKFIQMKLISSDRHHVAEIISTPSLENQINTLDIILKPFNRKNKYRFDIVLTTDNSVITERDIKISTAFPIKWVELKKASEITMRHLGLEWLLHIFSRSYVLVSHKEFSASNHDQY
jgi:hypothetical protein